MAYIYVTMTGYYFSKVVNIEPLDGAGSCERR